jgi:sulfoxide reductase heme-binding subunit YedZ
LASPYWKRRLRRNLLIGTASLVAAALLFVFLESPQLTWRLSMATAYPGLLLVALSLLLGPINVLRGRPNPVSFDLRRDLGIWGALFGIAHVVPGIQVHFTGHFWYYFVFQPELRGWMPFRYDAFGVMNYAGLVATLGLALLLVLSNDRSLARLGVPRWKRLQQFNYVIFGMVVLHGLLYQVVENRTLPWIVVMVVVTTGVFAFQLAGYRSIKGSSPPPTSGAIE